MIDQAQMDRLFDCDMVDAHGEKIGSVKQVWVDDRTGHPLWAEVHTGWFGMKDNFVPIQNADVGEGQIVVPMEKKQVKESPHIDIHDGHMSDEQQAELYRYYGMVPSPGTGDHDRMPGGRTGERAGRRPDQRTGERADTSGQGMTRHEEELHAGTRDVEAGRVRLVKHVVTEQQNVSVPVSHEEVRVVREPAGGTREAGRDAFTDGQAEVTLHRQEPVVEKTVKAVENVRLEKDTVTEEQQVGGKVRKERIDIEDDGNNVTRDKR